MIAKRNTEGYVLAYLLIVITVMGVIAATLMTSTLQVVQAQEKSLVYMQEKYEVQGELERFISELDIAHPTIAITSSIFRDDSDAAYNDAISRFLTYLNNLESSDLTTAYNVSYTAEDGTFSFLLELSNDSACLTANITCSPELIAHVVPVTIPDDVSTPTINESDSYTNYSYTISGINNLVYTSYKITSTGGGT